MRRTKRIAVVPVNLRKQKEIIRDVMLSAGECATWLTLDELAKLTQYPPASISAQLRHLRKPRFGAFKVTKRCRTVNPVLRAEGFGPVWEYSVAQHASAPTRKGKRRRRALRQVIALALS